MRQYFRCWAKNYQVVNRMDSRAIVLFYNKIYGFRTKYNDINVNIKNEFNNQACSLITYKED